MNDFENLIYFTPFSSDKFCKIIDKYLDFKYWGCDLSYQGKLYHINLFKNINGNLQIGAVGYGCIFPFPENFEIFYNLLFSIRKKYGIISKIVLPPFLYLNEDFIKNTKKIFQVCEKYTAILDLKKYRKLGDNLFKGSVRTDIKFAQKHDVKVEVCTSQSKLEDFYKFYKTTMDRVKSGYYTPKDLMKDLIDNKTAKLLLAVKDRKIIAGSMFLNTKTNNFYWINAYDYQYRNLRGNYLILKTAIDKSLSAEKVYFNFGYSHNENILKSKLSWGCNLEKYYILEKGSEKFDGNI